MKTWKKLFSLFCATVMMCSLLAGCGNSPDTPADDASSEDGGTDWPTKSINMIVPMGAGATLILMPAHMQNIWRMCWVRP